jgi:hypothetical protein
MMSAGFAGEDCGSVTMPASTNTITGIADFIFGLLAVVPAAPGAKIITPPALCERATLLDCRRALSRKFIS